MLKLYFHATPNSMKVLVLLHELGKPFEAIPIDIFKGEQHAADFLTINPNGKVPALVDGDVVVFDSHAILLYLAEKHGAFIPKTPVQKAQMLSWLQFVATGLSPFSGQAIHFLHYAPEDFSYAKTRYVKELERHYQVLDRHLSHSPWLAGADYSIADMALWGWAASAGMIFGERGLGDFPQVENFMRKMAEREAVMTSLAFKNTLHFKSTLDDESRQALFKANTYST